MFFLDWPKTLAPLFQPIADWLVDVVKHSYYDCQENNFDVDISFKILNLKTVLID